MSDRSDFEALFLEHLDWINRVAGMTAFRLGMWGAEAEDFVGWTRMKLLEDDYIVLRKFRGASSIRTFLASVIARFAQDYLRQRRGRWRPSVMAARLGPPAVELEALVYRDRYRLEQAGERLRTAGRTTLSDAELARLLARLPERSPRPVELDGDLVLGLTESTLSADAEFAASEAEARQRELLYALDHAMAQLSHEDREIVQMHFRDGRPLADVARALHLNRKPLSRRVEQLRLRLREDLASVTLRDFSRPGILGPDGQPITQEDLNGSRIITDVISANEKLVELVRRDPRSMYSLSSREFEELVAELLDQQGYQVALTPPSKDGGFDIAAARKDGLGEFLYLVECKRYAEDNKVGVEIVRSLYGIVEKEKATAGVVVTTSYFTKGAEAFQREMSRRITLRDYIHLQQWLGVTIIDPGPNTFR